MERIVGDLCDEVDRFYEEKASPDVCPDAPVTVAIVDKKGIIIRKPNEDRAGSQAPAGNPEKPGRKKMATVISTHVTPHHVRTADDMLRDVSDDGRTDSKPKPRNKVTWESLTEGPEETVVRLNKFVDQRLPKGNELVCILDGERSLWKLVYRFFPTAFFVLDIFYVLEHLGKAALCFHDEGSAQAREFVTERLSMLLVGRAGRMIGGLKQMLSKHKLSNAKRHSLQQVIGYLERNRKHMRYEICLAKGYPSAAESLKGHVATSSTIDWNSRE